MITPNEEIVEWAWVAPEKAMSYPLNSYTRVLIADYMEKMIDNYDGWEERRAC
ncbi:hypothetical protein [Limnoraphis robusta]|uniref:hypothetical protein n=1 Tax=Limnoraphis robusta TaxID=1118279 RepID=UPI000AF5C488|nr:hypothetical protein [Limnoraphis robusta]